MQLERVAPAAVAGGRVVRGPGEAADQVAVRISDVHRETAQIADRDDLLVALAGLREVRDQDAAVPPRALHRHPQHVGVPARVVKERRPRLAARVLGVRRRLVDRQRGAEIRQHDEVFDGLVGERPRRRRELVQTGLEGGRVLEVEQLDEAAPLAATGMLAHPQRDGQVGRGRGQVDRDAGDLVALAVIAQREPHGVLPGDVRDRGLGRLAGVAHQRRRGQRGRFDDRAEGQAGHSLRVAGVVVEPDLHLDQLAGIGVDETVPGRVGADVGLGVAVHPDPLVVVFVENGCGI